MYLEIVRYTVMGEVLTVEEGVVVVSEKVIPDDGIDTSNWSDIVHVVDVLTATSQ